MAMGRKSRAFSENIEAQSILISRCQAPGSVGIKVRAIRDFSRQERQNEQEQDLKSKRNYDCSQTYQLRVP